MANGKRDTTRALEIALAMRNSPPSFTLAVFAADLNTLVQILTDIDGRSTSRDPHLKAKKRPAKTAAKQAVSPKSGKKRTRR